MAMKMMMIRRGITITFFVLAASSLGPPSFAHSDQTSSDTAAAAAAAADFVKKTIASHKISIFSKSYCPMPWDTKAHSALPIQTAETSEWYCKRAKAVFKELNQVPYIVELDQREDGWKIQDALSVIVGRRTVPQVFIDGKHIGDSDDTVEAYQNGELAELLGISGEDVDDL